MSPSTAAALADALLALHVLVVLFVVGGLLLVLAGGALGWRWVRHRGFRLLHLCAVVFIVVQTWLGQLCPLTIWEQDLRLMAGQAGYSGGFIEYWLSRLIFFDAPWWVFVLAYTAFGAAVLGSWWWLPPGGGRGLALFGRRD